MTDQAGNTGRRVLVLGCGSIGRRHLANLIRLDVGEVLAYDVDSDARQAVEAEFGIHAARGFDEAWDQNPDVVLVAAPTQRHMELAIEAVQRGCHLFVEKPLSHCMNGVDDLCAELERRELVNMVGCNMRFHAGPMTVKRCLEDGAIGDVLAARLQTGSYLPRWHPQADYRAGYSARWDSGGAVLDCIHEIDLALWYLGPGRLVGAHCLPARSIGLETDGLAELVIEHESGALCSVHLNFVQRDYRRTCQIIGSEGTVYWDEDAGRVVLYGPDGQVSREIPDPDGWTMNRMYVDEMAHFLDAVRSRSATVNPVRQAVSALRTALEARQNAGSVCV